MPFARFRSVRRMAFILVEVIEADATAPGFTLSNTLAQEQAQELLADADDYF